MKKISVLFLIICILFVSGCATADSEVHNEILNIAQISDAPLQQRYSIEYTDFPQSIWFSSSNIASLDNKVFLLGNYMDSSYLYCFTADSLIPTLLASCEDGSEQWYAYCSLTDKLYVLDVINNQLIELDSTGERLRCVALPDDMFVYDIASDGKHIFALSNGMIVALEPDNGNAVKQMFSIKVSSYASIANNSDGRVFVAWKDGEVQAISEIDVDRQRLQEASYFSSDCTIAGVGHEWEVYLRIGGGLYGYNLSNKNIQKLLSFSELGLKSDGVVYELGDNNFLYTGTFGEIASVPIVLKPTEKTGDNITLVLATIGELPYAEEKAVRAWNQLHPECIIEVKDYNSNSDVRAAEYQLVGDIGSGKGPDLFNLSEPITGRLIRRGLLENLYPYIDNDPELSRSDFVSGPLSALEVNGTLPQIAPGFSLLTTIAAKKDVGDMPDFSYKNLSQLVDTSAYYQSIFDMGYSKDQWLRIMVASSGDKLVDWSESQCSFDSEYFKNLLSLSASRTEQTSFSGGSISNIIEASHSVLYMLVLNDIWQAAIADDAYGAGNYVYVGIPEVGNVISPEIDIGMSIQSPNKEECWQFIREFLLRESPYVTEIPLRRDGVRQRMIKEMEDMKEYSAQHPSREEAMEHLISVIENTDILYQNDTDLWSIIQSEANKFYAGQNTVDKTVQVIQSRASLYLSEQS